MGTENGLSESRAGEVEQAGAQAGAAVDPVVAAQAAAGIDSAGAQAGAGEGATAGPAPSGGVVEAQAGAAGVGVAAAGASPSEVVGGGEVGTAGAGEAAVPPADTGTSSALLASGRKLFAKYGFDGASVRAITADAGANLGAVTYHYGSKRALYNRVVERTVAPLVGRVE